ncbi:hypothetical protein [uncultured Clostridium sp.]|uniref:hypothetical protein n=1 Tax=uncultured Clostridium sp. TaxID=59620 RepID=UPI00262EE78A|nr:hypothetical protein [uncultured Clostridium sp.]
MNTKVNKSELYKLSSVEIYKMVLTRDLFRFPKGFWLRPDAEKNAIEVTKYLLENVLNFTDEQIKTKITNEFFRIHRLSGMLHIVFNCSTYKAINTVYLNKFKPWELICVPQSYWTSQSAIQSTKWLIEERLKYSEIDIKKHLTLNIFTKNGLGGMVQTIYNNSSFKAISLAYPGKFKPWELINVPNGYWNVAIGIEAIKWLIEDILKLSPQEAVLKVNLTIINKYKLSNVVDRCFEGSYKKAIKTAFPELVRNTNV